MQQHLQGVYAHGRFIKIYRQFGNTLGGANSQIHSFLLAIESILLDNSCTRDTLYYQVDGGSENTAKSLHALCELLVIKKVFRKVVLCRLPVGHTHEDIDAKFAKIWRKIRSAHVLKPKQYQKYIYAALQKKKANDNGQEDEFVVDVVDLFVIPNYTEYFSKYIDNEFGRYARLEWTQLEFTFECIPICPDFPLGVKTSYRPYTQDSVVRIVKDPNATCGVIDEMLVDIKPMPYADPENNIPQGMYILQSLPEGEVYPEKFVPGSRAALEKVAALMKSQYELTAPETVREWEQFLEIAPQNDDVADYVTTTNMYLPLSTYLFNNFPLDASASTEITANVNHPRISRPLDSVSWRRRGKKRSAKHIASQSSSEIISGPPGVRKSVPINIASKLCDSSKDSESDERNNWVSVERNSRNATYMDRIGMRFVDTQEDDGIIFVVTDICQCSGYIGFYFKYIDERKRNKKSSDDFEYTLCEEMLNSNWCQWLSSISSSSNSSKSSSVSRKSSGK